MMMIFLAVKRGGGGGSFLFEIQIGISVLVTSFRQTLLQTEIFVRHLFEVLLQTQLYPIFTAVTRTKRETYSSYPFRIEIMKERILNFTLIYTLNGHASTHLAEALSYKP
jgi:hypothetical protein